MKNFKIVFMGTPEFAVPSLKMLVDEGYDVVAVVTQPDRPKGRGNKLTPPPVKEYALTKGIMLLQPEKVKTVEFANSLKSLEPNLFITAAYGRILTKEVLSIPSYGCINVHGSLLPKYRGASPIQTAVINGDEITGITTMLTDVGMDTGDILLKNQMEISLDMTAGDLHDEMSILGASTLKMTLELMSRGELVRIPQEHENATHCPMLKKEDGLIHWNKTTLEIQNQVRGTNPWPGAFTYLNQTRYRIWKTRIINNQADILETNEINPGTILKFDKNGFYVKTGDGVLEVIELQLDSSRKMNVQEFAAGHNLTVGETFAKE